MDVKKDNWDGVLEKPTLRLKKRLLGFGLNDQDGIKRQNHQTK